MVKVKKPISPAPASGSESDEPVELETVEVQNGNGSTTKTPTPEKPKSAKVLKRQLKKEKYRAKKKLEKKQKKAQALEQAKTATPITSKKLRKFIEKETIFIKKVIKDYMMYNRPEPEDLEDRYLLELPESKENAKRKKFLEKMKAQKEAANAEAAASQSETGVSKPKRSNSQQQPNREELLEKLHKKIALIAQRKNNSKKQRKVKKPESSKTKAQFISKQNPNYSKNSSSNSSLKKDKDNALASTSSEPTEILRPSKPIKRSSDGQIVYSKFDFIKPVTTTGASSLSNPKKPSSKSKTELLKSALKTGFRIERLETKGQKSEAVKISQDIKWTTALSRAKGEKVRDDPELLKKSLKKETKMKKAKKKKWADRVETIEKHKKLKLKKRVDNLQERKEAKKTKVKKLQRKLGRIL